MLFRKRAKAGVTLVELMVVFGLTSLIATVLITLVGQSSSLVAHGVRVIGLNQKARFTIDKMAPYLITAISDGRASALKRPLLKETAPTAEELLAYTEVQFTTTEDFLDPNYKTQAPWDPTIDGDRHYYYEIYFDLSEPVPYTLEDGSSIDLGRVMMRRYKDAEFVEIDDTVEPYPLGFEVQHFHCYKLTADSLKVVIRTVGKRKGPAGNMIDVFQPAQAILTIPAKSYG